MTFEEWWAAYPRKVGKRAAKTSWDRQNLGSMVPRLIEAVENHKQSEQWLKGFIPNPATWLNQARWNDDLPKPKGRAVSREQPKLEAAKVRDYWDRYFEENPEV